MKILYLGCHSVLEYDEMCMFNDLHAPFDIEIFSMLGSFMNPTQSGDYMRSVIPHSRFYPELYGIALQSDKDNIHPELLEWADVVLFMHNSKLPNQKSQQPWVVNNWDLLEKMKKKVIWRSIGQSTPGIEQELAQYRSRGLKIVRYSPLEEKIPNYAGADAIIRFAKDPNEFKGWTGEKPQVITLAQSFKKRGDHLGFPIFERVTSGFNTKVYGTQNEDLGELWAGNRDYQELKQDLREARVFFYFGTVPAPYTLSLMEAMMTGVPVVAVGSQLRHMDAYNWPNYEVPDIIQNGINGYVSDDINDLRGYIQLLLENPETARRIGDAGRRTAMDLFGIEARKTEWVNFIKSI